MKQMKWIRFAPVGLVAILLSAFLAPAVLANHEADNVEYRHISGDSFANWDFQSNDDESTTNVDWPITMVFWNDADVNLVKQMYYGIATIAGSMHARLNDGSGLTWDSDRGTKRPECPIFVSANHMRIYADSDDQMYNTAWGYYVVAATHQDYNECNPWPWATKWSGMSEDAEEHFADLAESWYGDCDVEVANDWDDFGNYQDYEYVSSEDSRDHVMDNSGDATAVYLPEDFNPNSWSCLF